MSGLNYWVLRVGNDIGRSIDQHGAIQPVDCKFSGDENTATSEAKMRAGLHLSGRLDSHDKRFYCTREDGKVVVAFDGRCLGKKRHGWPAKTAGDY